MTDPKDELIEALRERVEVLAAQPTSYVNSRHEWNREDDRTCARVAAAEAAVAAGPTPRDPLLDSALLDVVRDTVHGAVMEASRRTDTTPIDDVVDAAARRVITLVQDAAPSLLVALLKAYRTLVRVYQRPYTFLQRPPDHPDPTQAGDLASALGMVHRLEKLTGTDGL